MFTDFKPVKSHTRYLFKNYSAVYGTYTCTFVTFCFHLH